MRRHLEELWRLCKRWRSIPLGPVALAFRMQRNTSAPTLKRWRTQASRPKQDNSFGSASRKQRSSWNLPGRTDGEVAVVFGAGRGYGYGLARYFTQRGMKTALVSRNAWTHERLVGELRAAGGIAGAYSSDATSELSVARALALIEKDLGVPHLVVICLQGFCPGRAIEVEVCAFEESWRQNCLGPFIVARDVARMMVPLQRGTIIFTGATSGTIGRAGYLNLAVGKWGLRGMAQVMAKELQPQGLHVAHLIIDADILEGKQDDGQPHMCPGEIAQTAYFLHNQPRSAWTHELDARPWNEAFWDHC